MLEDLINLLTGNLGIGFENLVLLITILGSVMFFAKDFRLGSVILLVFFGCEFVYFSLAGWDTLGALIAVLTSITLLTLSLFATSSKSGVIT